MSVLPPGDPSVIEARFVRVVAGRTGDVVASGVVQKGVTSQVPELADDEAVVRILDAAGIVVATSRARSGAAMTDVAWEPVVDRPGPDALEGGSRLTEPRLALERALECWRSAWCVLLDPARRHESELAFDRVVAPARAILHVMLLAELVLQGAPASTTRFPDALFTVPRVVLHPGHSRRDGAPMDARALRLLEAACAIHATTRSRRRVLAGALDAAVRSLGPLTRVVTILRLPEPAARVHAALFLEAEPPPPPPPEAWGPFSWPPDDGGDERPEEPVDPPTTGSIWQRILEIREQAGTYVMTAIAPASACAGDVVTITGTGFNPGVEAVVFTGTPVSIAVPPLSSTSTSVTVAVPPGAISGPVSLQVPAGALDPSLPGSLIIMKSGNAGAIHLAIDSPVFVSVTVNGVRLNGPVCVPFDSDVEIAWVVSPATAAVNLEWDRWGLAVNRPAVSSIIVPSSTPSIELIADGPCGSATEMIDLRQAAPPATLSVAAVELTQGIQALGRGSPVDNSVPMLRGRDTVIRVYLDAGLPSGSIAVTGRATLDDGTELLSDPTIVSVGAYSPDDRGSAASTLNFMIPASGADGVRRLTIECTALVECGPVPELEHVVVVPFAPSAAVPITLVLIRDLSGAMPGFGDAMSTLAQAVRLLPIRDDAVAPFALVVDVAVAMLDPFILTSLGPLLVTGYANDAGMWAHSQLVSRARAGWPAFGICVGVTSGWTRGMMAWPDTRSCITNLDATRMAHEIAHCLGLGHVVTGAGEYCDSGITTLCETLPNGGRLLDVPFDVEQMRTIGGQPWDLMTYRSPRWTSPEHWLRLYESSLRW